MSATVANSPYSRPYPDLKRYLRVSGICHVVLIGLMILSAFFKWPGNQWAGAGGGGDNIKVNLVGSAGIPMPKQPVVTESNVVDPTKSLHKEEEKPKPPEPPTKAEKVPQFEKNKPPLPPTHKSKVFEKKQLEPENAVPGHGGPPNLPTGAGSTPGSSPGLAIKGEGGGDFASRYGWYIDSVKRRIQQNWLQNTIDPNVRTARMAKTTMEFTIGRDGTIKDIRMVQSSGNMSMDNSGQRALLASSPLPALPSDYSGSYVRVTFDFDLSQSR
ncbi:MAG TPA: energy transducer TonB [Candidatus Angelobacter sp.]|nr:energy transducer TonB [Candidatus Angelobacter sp.]